MTSVPCAGVCSPCPASVTPLPSWRCRSWSPRSRSPSLASVTTYLCGNDQGFSVW